MTTLNSFVSVVVPIRNVESEIGEFLRALAPYLEANFTDYEILLIDQCSTDRTIAKLQELLLEIRSVRCLRLSFAVDTDTAFAAGMESAIGDYVVLFTLGVDPIECIRRSVELGRQGVHVVIGVSIQAQTVGYRVVRPCIQFLLRSIGYDLPRNATSFRCLTRKAVNCVTETGRFHHQLFVRISRTGYESDVLNYRSLGLQKKTIFAGLKQTLNMMVFNSTAPLRWMSVVGAAGSFLSFCFAAYSILIRLFKDDVIEGWTSLAFVMSFLFMLLFVILAFFGEYLGRLLDDRSEHRDYSIVGELSSSVMVEVGRLNVSEG